MFIKIGNTYINSKHVVGVCDETVPEYSTKVIRIIMTGGHSTSFSNVSADDVVNALGGYIKVKSNSDSEPK